MTPSEAIRRLTEVCRRQHKAESTSEAYAGWLRRYMAAALQMPTTLPSEQKLERFLTELACRDKVAASTQNQAFNAIVFFYAEVLGRPLGDVSALRASRPARLRRAPSVAETADLLKAVRKIGGYPTNLVARLLYGCGLRVSEPLNLRVKDLQDDRLFIVGGKGRKDRVVALPCSLSEELRGQLDFARAVHKRDAEARIPVAMPEALARKYPGECFSWPWAWLFPAHQPCQHPITGAWVRWRMHEANVQRAIKEARRRLGIMVLPHELRHAYATHCLDRGTNVKALQEAMGHAQVETTIGYCHAEALSVRSPLESMGRGNEAEAARNEMRDGTEDVTRPPPRYANHSHNAIGEPSLRSEIVLEIKDRSQLRSGVGSQLEGKERARQEQSFTDRAITVAANYRNDGYLMTKLERNRKLREELMGGQTPTARKFAVSYERKPQWARELVARALELPGNAGAYLNTCLREVTY